MIIVGFSFLFLFLKHVFVSLELPLSDSLYEG